MNVLLSIKPKYVEKIKEGSKKYEFRKSLFTKNKLNKINRVYIYSSSPVKKIVARFMIEEILEAPPEYLWKECKEYAGIDELEFFKYFKNYDKGFAIKISDLELFKAPIDPHCVIPNFTPPQSFFYLKDMKSFKRHSDFI